MELLFKKQGLPEESELVMCTVTNIYHNSVFVNIHEYSMSGLIHISEIAPGRIRNIHDFVRPGKVIVCKVLRVDKEKGQVDLSLRRVTESQRRGKTDEIKQEQKAEKILEFVAKDLNMKLEELYKAVSEKVLGKYPKLFICFEEIIKKEDLLKNLGLPEKIANELTAAIKLRIKPIEVQVKGNLMLKSFEPNGIEIIKNSLSGLSNKDIKITYYGAAKYGVIVTGADYKTVEKILKGATDKAIEHMHKHNSEASFERT